MKNIIKFIPETKIATELLDGPTPASLTIPSWYSSAGPLMGNDKAHGIMGNHPTPAPNTTYKHCSPFLDAFITGYIWSAPVDFEIKRTSVLGDYIIRWRTDGDFVSEHEPDQHPNLPSPHGSGDNGVLKWEFPYKIETPKGYSTLFTHPLNRSDLPFKTFSGVVDTDAYPIAVRFPFQIMDFEGDRIIIEKGTPLCQIIPIKRDSWKMEMGEFDEVEKKKSYFEFTSKIVKSYKSQYWTRKSYK